MLGAPRTRAQKELKESLDFEIALAELTVPREETRDATKFYHPMQLGKVREETGADMVPDWTKFVNRMLTEDVLQVNRCIKH